MAKYRSKTNYAQIYNGDRQGFNLGIDGAIFLKQEAVPRTFQAPSIGTQGQSEGDTAASDDISAHASPGTLNVSVRGAAAVTASVVTAGLNTGALIAAALETAINTALVAAGSDDRVWVDFDSGDDHYTVYDQGTGTASTVVITDGVTNDIAADLLLGTANGGTETAGTDDTDFLLYTTGGPTFNQPIESNAHRSGRFHSGIVKSKKVAEFGLSTYINMSGAAGESIDPAVRLLWKSLMGTETVVAATAIRYTQGLPNFTMSMVRVSTIFAEYYTGAYVREMNLAFPGDGPATCEWSGKASTRLIAGIARVNGAVAASANVILENGQTDRYDVGAPVMVVGVDGQTILYGADGSLTISSITAVSHTLVLSGAVTTADESFIVPWSPGAVQQTGRDAIFTDLEGSFKLKASGSNICVTNISLAANNDHYDVDNCFGVDHNEGFAAASRMTYTLGVTFDLSNENFAEVVQSTKFEGLDPIIILGATSGRHLKISAPKWIPAVPTIEVPESGSTPVTLEGNLFQSTPGAQDPILIEFL